MKDETTKAPLLSIPKEFWEALISIHNHYFAREVDDFWKRGRPAEHIAKSLMTLSCLLDAAEAHGCLDTDAE